MIEQFEKVANWTINHDKLLKELKEISKFMDIDIKVIYRTVILDRIGNGVEFIETYEKISESITGIGPSPIKENKTIQVF